MLIIRVFNVVGEYGRRHSNSDQVLLLRYQQFVHDLSHQCRSSYSPHTTTDEGKRVSASILFHPVWNELASAARALLPSNPAYDQLRSHLDILEAFKAQPALRNYAPLSFDWTAQLYPDYEHAQPYITVDIDSEARVEETRPSVPVDNPSFAAALPDGVEEDREEVARPGIGTVLNLGTTLSFNPLLIPPYGLTLDHISSSPYFSQSIPLSVLPARTEVNEDLLAEQGDAAAIALEEDDGDEGDEDEEGKEKEKEEKEEAQEEEDVEEQLEEEENGPSVGGRLTSRLGDGD